MDKKDKQSITGFIWLAIIVLTILSLLFGPVGVLKDAIIMTGLGLGVIFIVSLIGISAEMLQDRKHKKKKRLKLIEQPFHEYDYD